MRVLGMDPGLQITGYGLVELRPRQIEPNLIDGGYIRLPRKLGLEARLTLLHKELAELIEQGQPQRIAVERLFSHYKHPRTAILMAHARGVILLCAMQHNLDIDHLSPTEVKKAMTGNGQASKRQMQLAVASQCRLAEPPNPPDVADAIAIAMTCARRIALDQL